MTEETYNPEEIFFERYPELFDKGYFIEVWIGMGWEKIVDKALQAIRKYNENNPTQELESSIIVVQIKEKFGGLRIYTNYTSPEIEEAIKEAEKEAGITCESCGTKEDVTLCRGAWLKTLCKKCNDIRYK